MNFMHDGPKKMKNDPMDHIFDLEKYPINDLSNPITKELITRCNEELEDVGCAVIRNFVKPESLLRMQKEATRKIKDVCWSEDSHNPYMTNDDPSFPTDHPKRFFERRESGYINSDILDEDSDLNAIYDSQIMLDFISACINISPLYCWADPLGNHPYSVMDDGHYFPWHFDGNDFTVSILVQESDEGGLFEYAPNIRNKQNENFNDIAKILHGDRQNVCSLRLRPGDMQLFKGRYSLHRVTRVKGAKRRIIALPTYATNPYTVNKPGRAKRLYGRALPIHYERESIRPDQLTE